MEQQIANTFDRKTLKSIAKGFGIAFLGFFMTWLGSNIDLIASMFKDHPMVASLVTMICSTAVNMFYQYKKGITK